jgi:subtilisin family serine protease
MLMKRSVVLAAGLSALLVLAVAPATTSGRDTFGRISTGGRRVHVDRLPSMNARNRFVHVAVELSARPVTIHQGAALARGNSLSEARRNQIRRQLRIQQRPARRQIRATGARIEASFTDVFNGFRIRARVRQLDRIARIKGVKALYSVPIHTRDTATTGRYIGADTTWGQTGFTGKGVTIAIIDSGINYDHRAFAGRGAQAWQNNDPTIREPGSFPTAKVIGGWDLVGDDYFASEGTPPQPDPDPLDCKDRNSPIAQHGTHVAGIAAGVGVRATGGSYSGPYNARTLTDVAFRIAPGVAPEARLMAFRVFGCDGDTQVVVDAIERAVRAGADVINMSLGTQLGNPDSIDAVATNNASLAGVTVVASSGNEGPSAYITGAPGAASRAISTAAMDAVRAFPGATVNMAAGPNVRALNSNNSNGLPVSGAINHFRDNPNTPINQNTGAGGEHFGCHAADYQFNNFQAGQIAVVQRGICPRVDRAVRGTERNAAAVIMVNDSATLPPYENAIPGASIPFIGVPSSVNGRFRNQDGRRIRIQSAGRITNDAFKHTADFTSAGPRRGDSGVKPDIVAPGVSVFSADGGSTGAGKSLSGTSMASPAVAGVAALVLDAHPSWLPHQVKAAIVGTASPGLVAPYDPRFSGSGVAWPRRAVSTVAYALAANGTSSISFGYQSAGDRPSGPSFSESRRFRIENTSNRQLTFAVSNRFIGPRQGVRVSISPARVRVPARSSREVRVTISMTAAAAAQLPDTVPEHAPAIALDDFGQPYTPITMVTGAITARPTTSGRGVYSIRVPWQVVPRGISNISPLQARRTRWTISGNTASTQVTLRNSGPHLGIADVYSWGLQDGRDGLDGIDLRAGGIQSLPTEVCTGVPDASDRCLVFAVNTWGRWNNAAENEIDVLIDRNTDEQPDFAVIGVDTGLLLGTLFGVTASAIINTSTNELVNIYFASAGVNGSTVLLPALASDLGLSRGGDPEFDWWVESYDVYDDDGSLFQFDLMLTGNAQGGDAFQLARYNAFNPALNNGQFRKIPDRQTRNLTLRLARNRYLPRRGHKGWMVVTLDDASGERQADLIPVGQVR